MSQIPAWREAPQAPGSVPPRRHRVLALLLVLAALLVGVGYVVWSFRAPPTAHWTLISLGDLPWRAADHDALVERLTRAQTHRNLDQAGLVRALRAVGTHRGDRVVYLSAPAKRDAQGRVCVLPADADPSDPATWLSLARIDEILGPKRFLILDLVGDEVHGESRSGPTLEAASPGQGNYASEYRGRSALGHYVEMGLLGGDTNGDQRVHASELSAYVRERVDRWSRLVRGERQTPAFQGEGPDMPLTLVRRPPLSPDLPEPRTYPIWLTEAWAKSDALLPVERAWRDGGDEAALKRRAADIVARPPQPLPRPPERSLAFGAEPSEALIETVRRYAAQRPTPPADAFLKDNKPTPAQLPSWAAAIVAVVTDDATTLPALAPLLAAVEPRPETEETLLIARLARLNPPRATLRQVLETQRDLRRLYEPLGFSRRRAEAERLAQAFHDALVVLESRGYAPDTAARQLTDLQGPLANLLARQTGEVNADLALAEARRLFAEARSSGLDAPLPRARERYTALERKLAGPPGDRSDETAALRDSLTALAEPFSADGVARRIRDSKRSDSPEAWLDLDRLLAAQRTANRPAVYAAAQDLGRRLEEENARRDDRDGARLEGIPEVVRPSPRPAFDPPATPPVDNGLWAWLADRYRYEWREALVADPDSLAAGFYRRAAQDYQKWLDLPRETYAEVTQANDPPRLLPNEPITLQLNVRVSPAAPPVLDILRPDDEWLRLTPERPMPDAEGNLVLGVALRESAGTGRAPAPLGLLARATVAGRTYHRRINLPLTPRVPQVVLAPEGVAPGEITGQLGLRAVAGRQPFVLHLRNPIDKAWAKLAVRLTVGTETKESLPLALGGLETKAVEFPASTAPLPPVLPEARQLSFRVVNLDAKGEEVTAGTVALKLANPENYARITALDYNPKTTRLTVRLRQRATVAGPPVSAELQIPTPEQGGANFREGTLRGALSPKGEELTLFAEGVTGEGTARFAVGIDGWARAFPFRATLTPRGGMALPEPLPSPAVRLATGPFGVAGPAFRVPLEVDNAPPGAAVEVAIGRLVGGAFREEVTARREGGRDERIGVAVPGPMLVFEAGQRDWAIPLETTRIRGPRTLVARLVAAGGRELARDERPVTLGDEAPGGVRFLNPPESAWNKAPLPLVASGADPVVGVKEVFFFVGKPAMDKVPEGAFKAVATRREDGNYATKLPLPADRKGPTDVTVGMTNKVGLTAFATHTLDLRDEDPEKTRPASIRGTLTEGDRVQPGIDVVLSDEKGQEKARVKTDDDGKYVFNDVAPGKYRLTATKSRTSRKAAHPRDKPTFEVAPGAKLTIDLTLFL